LGEQRRGHKIESIKAEPRGHDDARYVVTLKQGDGPSSSLYGPCCTDGPAPSLREINDAGIQFSVKSKDESSIWPQVLVWWLPMLLLVGISSCSCASCSPAAARR